MPYGATRNIPVRVPLATRPLGLIATARAARRNLLELIPAIATERPMISAKTAIRWHMVMEPRFLEHILKDNVANYPKSTVTKSLLRPAIGESLFIAEGAEWRWQRRAAAPAFAHRNVTALAPVMSAAAEATSARLARTTGPVDLYAEAIAATFDVISDVTFSGSEGFDRAAVHRAIDAYIARTARVSLMDVAGIPDWIPRPSRIFGGRDLRRMKALADEAITARAATGPRIPPDLLDLLRAGQDDETGRTMTEAELRDNLLTFIVAGHETTALTLAWALYLCAFDEAEQDRASAQAREVLGDRVAGADDVAALDLTARIVNESLRLYPPAAFLSRTAREADRLGAREIRPGDTVMLPIYALHRSKLHWDEPDAFRPARFAPDVTRDRFAFLPFGAGPRICIGASFALQEAVIILATLLARHRFVLTERQPVPRLILTLRPEGGVWLRVTPR
ncbi:MAG: cytochrome P450 [Paracoccus sp. (in: a-proteobacteria)]|nr:cytochrome P450 [Paracoccus sp. (in: a-proteobacteria)]